MKLKKRLKRLGACEAAVDWVGDMTQEEAWEKCDKGNWMIWYYAHIHPDDLRKVAEVKLICTSGLLEDFKDITLRKALDHVQEYVKGSIDRYELRIHKLSLSKLSMIAQSISEIYAIRAVSSAIHNHAFPEINAIIAHNALLYSAIAKSMGDPRKTPEYLREYAEVCRRELTL